MLKLLLDVSKNDFNSFLNMEHLVNSLTTDEIESKINFIREGAFKFIGFLVIEN